MKTTNKVDKELYVENGSISLAPERKNGYREPGTWYELETSKYETVPEDILNMRKEWT